MNIALSLIRPDETKPREHAGGDGCRAGASSAISAAEHLLAGIRRKGGVDAFVASRDTDEFGQAAWSFSGVQAELIENGTRLRVWSTSGCRACFSEPLI